jgi:glycosyltransferase involved in cell wall biosynthesis
MIKKSLVIILCNLPWEWSTDYINQTAYELSKNNTVICFFWLQAKSLKEHVMHPGEKIFFHKIQDNLYAYYGAHLLPFRRFALVEQFNVFLNVLCIRIFAGLLRTKNYFDTSILWFFDPRMYPIVKYFGRKYTTIYDCVDYYSGDARLSTSQRDSLRTIEKKALKQADLVTVNSYTLFNVHKKNRSNLVLVPQGFRLDSFASLSKKSMQLPTDKPIIGYVGAINDRLDYPLLVKLIKRLPSYMFLFAGPIIDIENEDAKGYVEYAQKNLFTLPNVSYVGSISKNDIPNLIQHFSVGIIPYRNDDSFNTYAFPMKVLEYFYMGKPVVSSDIVELRRYPKFVMIASSVQEWQNAIERAVYKKWTFAQEQRREAIRHSWEHKVQAISDAMATLNPLNI